MAALRAWAGDDLRSLNGQIEFLLRRALREAGRLSAPTRSPEADERAIDDDEDSKAMSSGAVAAAAAMKTRG